MSMVVFMNKYFGLALHNIVNIHIVALLAEQVIDLLDEIPPPLTAYILPRFLYEPKGYMLASLLVSVANILLSVILK